MRLFIFGGVFAVLMFVAGGVCERSRQSHQKYRYLCFRPIQHSMEQGNCWARAIMVIEADKRMNDVVRTVGDIGPDADGWSCSEYPPVAR